MKRNDIYWCDLPYYSENIMTKTRPCIIVSNDAANQSSTAQVIPLCSNRKRLDLPCHVMTRHGIARVENIITIDRDCVIDYFGTLDDKDVLQINISIMRQLGIL